MVQFSTSRLYQDLSFQAEQKSSQLLFLKVFLHLGMVGPLCLFACGEMYVFFIATAPFHDSKMRGSPWPKTDNLSLVLILDLLMRTIKKRCSCGQRQLFKKNFASLFQKNGFLKDTLSYKEVFKTCRKVSLFCHIGQPYLPVLFVQGSINI